MDRTSLQTSDLGRNGTGLWADIKIAIGKPGYSGIQ